MNKTRHFALLLLVVLLLGACGGGAGGDTSGDDASGGDDSVTTTARTVAGGEDEGSTDTGSGAVDVGNNGSVRFEISGNWEDEGEWPFIPAASVFVNDIWSMSFAPKIDGTGDGILTIMLDDESFFVTYGTNDGVISGGIDQCQVDIDRSEADGTAGNFECTNLVVLPTNGSMTDGVNFSGTFETHS
ncbi:MAG: hypothetical protein WD651_13740 [Acidimicrobiia bacterium]